MSIRDARTGDCRPVARQPLNESISRSLKQSQGTRGVVVTEAVPLKTGAAAALVAGDVIVKFQQLPVTSTAQLNRLVAGTAPGSL